MIINISTAIDKGKERENNEDAIIYCPDLTQNKWCTRDMEGCIPLGECGAVAVVADGMGGALAGEVASALAIESVQHTLEPARVRQAIGNDELITQLLREATANADQSILNRATADPDTTGMGSTIVICWMMRDKAYIAWCGDSRCYVHRPDGALTQLTIDHSLVQEMVDDGQITQEEALNHPDSNIITRALGDVDRDAEPDIVVHPMTPGDTYILCSDGLCGYCTQESIERAVSHHDSDSGQMAQALMKLAMDAGGHDNIGIIVATVLNDDQQPKGASLGKKLLRLLGL